MPSYLATNPQKSSGRAGLGLVEIPPTTYGAASAGWTAYFSYALPSHAFNRFRNRVALAPLHCRGFTTIIGRSVQGIARTLQNF